MNTARDRAALATAAVLAAVVVFAPAYGLFRFHDDWTFVDRAAAAVGSHQVLSFILHPLDQHWSPLWHAIETLNFVIAGWESDWFIRTIDAAATCVALVVCGGLLVSARQTKLACLAAVAVLAFHPATAAARFSFDTYSQVIADLLVWCIGALVAVRFIKGVPPRGRDVARIAALFGVGLLLKEQTLGAVVVVGLMALCARLWMREALSRQVLVLGAVLAAEAGVFTVVRRLLGVQFATDGPFRLCPPCAPVNIAELATAVLLPVRTLVVYEAVFAAPRRLGTAALALASAVAVAVFLTRTIWRSRRVDMAGSRLAVLAACGWVGSWFPVALLGHVGELYAHSSVFWLAVLFGIGADGVWRGGAPRRRIAVVLSGAAVAILLVVGLRANLGEMRATGERARRWLDRVARALAPLPDGALVVVEPPAVFKAPGDYGLYRLTQPSALVVTGQSPAAIRHAANGRLRVVLDEGSVSAADRGPVYRLRFAENDVVVERAAGMDVLAPSRVYR